MTNPYMIAIRPDPDAVRAREKRVKKVIAEMGDKYLLAKPVGRTNATVQKTVR